MQTVQHWTKSNTESKGPEAQKRGAGYVAHIDTVDQDQGRGKIGSTSTVG